MSDLENDEEQEPNFLTVLGWFQRRELDDEELESHEFDNFV